MSCWRILDFYLSLFSVMLQKVGIKNIHYFIIIIPCYNPLSSTVRSTLYCKRKSQLLFTNCFNRYKNKFSYYMKQTDSKYLNSNQRYNKYKNRRHFSEILCISSYIYSYSSFILILHSLKQNYDIFNSPPTHSPSNIYI